MRPVRRSSARTSARAIVGLTVALTLSGCVEVRPTSPPTPAPTSRTPTPTVPSTPAAQRTRTAPSTPTCADLTRSLSLAEQVGQLFMVGVDTGGLADGQAAAMTRAHVGSAVLLGNSTDGARAVRRLTAAVRRTVAGPRRVGLMIAVDQEGGQVQRLRGPGFDQIPSAMDQATQSDPDLRAAAERWGRQLVAAGLDSNLAPVADVVPTRLRAANQPIGVLRRGYGPDPGTVADKVTAFTTGMAAAGVLTSVKHFPGLGRVVGNTDFQAAVVDSGITRGDADLHGFRAAVAAGVDMVMVSSAYYAKIDRRRPAVFSTAVVRGMIRRDLGFTGVVISDDLAARAVQYLAPGERALRFLRAGGDLMIVGDPTLVAGMVTAVSRRASAEPAFARAVTRHATKVVEMKARRGLADCGD